MPNMNIKYLASMIFINGPSLIDIGVACGERSLHLGCLFGYGCRILTVHAICPYHNLPAINESYLTRNTWL